MLEIVSVFDCHVVSQDRWYLMGLVSKMCLYSSKNLKNRYEWSCYIANNAKFLVFTCILVLKKAENFSFTHFNAHLLSWVLIPNCSVCCHIQPWGACWETCTYLWSTNPFMTQVHIPLTYIMLLINTGRSLEVKVNPAERPPACSSIRFRKHTCRIPDHCPRVNLCVPKLDL